MQAIFFKVPMDKDKAVSSQAENLSLKYCGNFMYMGQHIIGFSLNKVTIRVFTQTTLSFSWGGT